MSTLANPTSADLFEVTRTNTPVPDEQREAALASPKFGTVFTEHMARISYSQESGWTGRRIEKYGPLLLHFAELIEQPVFNLFYPCGLPLEKLDDYP